MKGLLFYDYDGGRGGPTGILAYSPRWCVEVLGGKYHIPHEFPGGQGNVTVQPCDGSCVRLTDIPNKVWQQACLQFQPK